MKIDRFTLKSHVHVQSTHIRQLNLERLKAVAAFVKFLVRHYI